MQRWAAGTSGYAWTVTAPPFSSWFNSATVQQCNNLMPVMNVFQNNDRRSPGIPAAATEQAAGSTAVFTVQYSTVQYMRVCICLFRIWSYIHYTVTAPSSPFNAVLSMRHTIDNYAIIHVQRRSAQMRPSPQLQFSISSTTASSLLRTLSPPSLRTTIPGRKTRSCSISTIECCPETTNTRANLKLALPALMVAAWTPLNWKEPINYILT
jgi:hypothetical protein